MLPPWHGRSFLASAWSLLWAPELARPSVRSRRRSQNPSESMGDPRAVPPLVPSWAPCWLSRTDMLEGTGCFKGIWGTCP